jgi:D-arabinose 1-dehydrogenase-like Zn-dependent alcohol dehydrogenase
MLGVQFAKALGYRVVAIDNRPEGLVLAKEFSLKADLSSTPMPKMHWRR